MKPADARQSARQSDSQRPPLQQWLADRLVMSQHVQLIGDQPGLHAHRMPASAGRRAGLRRVLSTRGSADRTQRSQAKASSAGVRSGWPRSHHTAWARAGGSCPSGRRASRRPEGPGCLRPSPRRGHAPKLRTTVEFTGPRSPNNRSLSEASTTMLRRRSYLHRASC